MSEQTTLQRPTLIADTDPNTPWHERPSTWTGIVTILLDWSSFASLVAGLLTGKAVVYWLIASGALKLAAGNVGVIQTWCVRLGVTHSDQKTEKLAERLEPLAPLVQRAEATGAAVFNPQAPAVLGERTLADVAQERRRDNCAG